MKTRTSGKQLNDREGFTLVEILIVVSLFSIISLAVYRTIVSGYQIWERSLEVDHQEDVAFLIDQISQDLRNSYNFSRIVFSGKTNRCSFPAIVKTRVDKSISSNPAYADQMGRVEYYFDERKGRVIRRTANYAQALKGAFSSERQLAGGIKSLKFYYYVLNGREISILREFSGPLPMGIKLVMQVQEPGKNVRTVERFIPVYLKERYGRI